MELTREEIVKMINEAIKLALVNKSDTIHNHDDLYHQKDVVYTRNEVEGLIIKFNESINSFILGEVKKISDDLINNSTIPNETKEKKLTSITEKLQEIEKSINSINKIINGINENYTSIINDTSGYSDSISSLLNDVSKIKSIIPNLVTTKEFNTQFEIIEKKVFSL